MHAVHWRASYTQQQHAVLHCCLSAGSTTHIIDTSRGLVVEHIERWKSEPGEVRHSCSSRCCRCCRCFSCFITGSG